MSSPGPYSGYSREDLLRYISGTMLPAEMHALEKAALEDPFLSEALEGMQQEDPLTVRHNLENLDEQLAKKKDSKVVQIPAHKSIWRWAAAAVLIGMIGILAYFFSQKNEKEPVIAQQKEILRLDTVPSKSEDQKTATTIQPNEKKSEGLVTNEKNKQIEPIVPSHTPKPALAKSDERLAESKKSAAVSQDEENIKMSKSILPAEAVKDDAVASQGANVDKKIPAMKQRSAITNKEQSIYYFTGQVLHGQNQPLPYANISLLPSRTHAYTDVNGHFRLMAGDSTLEIEIKAEGFTPQIVQLNSFHANQNIYLLTASGDKKKTKARLRIKMTDSSRLQESGDENAEAEPRDGYDNYEWYLRNNIRISGEIKNYQNTGFVEISFIVSETGRLSDFRVEKSLCPACDNEIIRLIKEGPPWQVSGNKPPGRARISVVY